MTKEQINPSRSTIRRLYNIRPTAVSHGISSLQLLLLLSTALPFAIAQEGTESSDDPYGLEANFNPSMAVIISVFVCAFFIIGFFSVYLRQCTEASAAAAAGRAVGEGRSRVFVGGLKPEVIQNFPVFIYSAVKDLKIGKGALECAVCLNEFEDDDSLRLLPKCDHVFHPDCIDAWLVSHSTCPVCRANLVPESGEFVGDATQTLDSYDLPVEQNPRLELSESQNQVSIHVNEDQSRDSQSVEIVSTNQTSKQNWAPGSTARGGISGKFPRSHSTGHSLVQPGESLERYTLRLPEEVRRQIVMSKRLKRTTSCGVVLPREGSSRRGWRKGGEGSSRGKGNSDRYVGRFDRVGRSDRWVFSMAPPFLSRVASIPPPKSGGDGDVTPASSNNAKTFLTSVIGPLDCLAVKAEGTEQPSGRPPV